MPFSIYRAMQLDDRITASRVLGEPISYRRLQRTVRHLARASRMVARLWGDWLSHGSDAMALAQPRARRAGL